MMKYLLITLSILLMVVLSFAQQTEKNKIAISPDVELYQISENAFVHVSRSEIPPYGRVASNGLIFIDKKKAFLFDTPTSEALTKELVDYVQNSMKSKIVGFVPNHWHGDCMGGLAYLQSIGIPSYANEMTINLAKANSLPVPDKSFNDSLTINLNDKKIFCEYMGAAHSMDNIVVWIPSEKILFPGCMVKAKQSNNLGNTADGDIKSYPITIQKLLDKYPNAKIVVPGHGDFGDISLIKHTLELAK